MSGQALRHKLVVMGLPGTGKSTIGLSYPNVEQHVWGSSEEDTALGFKGRTDILPPVKFDWYDCLTDKERAQFEDEKGSETEVAILSKTARARNIARYRKYIYKVKRELIEGKRDPNSTIFLDNGTPFMQEFEDYVETIWGAEFSTKQGNFDSIAFYRRFNNEAQDFLRLLQSLPCHVVASFHISMQADELAQATTNFMDASKKGIAIKKEWQPLIMGKAKFALAGIFTWVFYLWCEESTGLPTKYLAKLEADDSNVGVAKGRIQPFANPRRIEIPKQNFYQFFCDALAKQQQEGK